MPNKNCPKCQGKGVVKEADGTIHTCWECLNNGDLDVHSKDVKESNIKI